MKEKETKNKRKNIKRKNSIKIKIDKVCNTPWKQGWGLMFSEEKTALFTFKKPQRVAIQTWFMRYPLTLIFLNKRKEVVEIKKNVKPWSYHTPKNNAEYLIEIPNKKQTQRIKVKDKMKIIKNE